MSFHPQTPQSPSQYSPSTADPATSMTNSIISSITTTLPTPAHSINGSSLPSEMATHDAGIADDCSNKRKRQIDDTGDREQKKVHIEDRRLGIESLHLDVGDKYLLCRTPHTPKGPDLTGDLFERFGLTSIAAEVARVLPNGEKNAIRKTYKGHIRKLGVAGHFDSVKEDELRPDGFLTIVRFPEEEWNVHHVRGKEIENGLHPDTREKMAKAMTMAKGILPKSYWDHSVLGDLGPGNVGKTERQASSARQTAPSTPLVAATAGTVPRAKSQLPAGQEAARPKRSIKKRTYGDSSYEGYGEGFPDDDGGPGSGYSTGEGEMGASGPKRKKKNPAGGQPYPQVRQQSYGPGMVGA